MIRFNRIAIRYIAIAVLFTFVFHVSPLAVLAAIPRDYVPLKREVTLDVDKMRPEVRSAVSYVESDLTYLKKYGKEKYVTRCFDRMDRDQQVLLKMLHDALVVYGPKKFVQICLGWANPVVQQIVEAILTFTMEAVYEAMEGLILKGLKRLKEEMVRISQHYMELGLQKLKELLSRDDIFAETNLVFDEKGHFEDFFGNSTVVKNFLIVAVSVASVAVAIGISLSTGGVAPIVAVLGALVSLIGLIGSNGKVLDEHLTEAPGLLNQ